MKIDGVFKKMPTEWLQPIQYYLDTNDGFISVNQLIGKQLTLKHTGYQCFNCKENNEIFNMGYCKKCFFIVPQTQQFVLKPELSKAHLGKEEVDLAWEKKIQLQPHIVYLANSGGLKVGVTRKTQIPTRWIDQGAHFALPILEVENRYLAGISEVEIAKHISDKTNYRKMLTGQIPTIDLIEWKKEVSKYLPDATKNSVLKEEKIYEMQFPLEEHPVKIQSYTFKKHTAINGVLKGIKAQYLLFEGGMVFNIRSHEGYAFSLELN